MNFVVAAPQTFPLLSTSAGFFGRNQLPLLLVEKSRSRNRSPFGIFASFHHRRRRLSHYTNERKIARVEMLSSTILPVNS
jgi:hypothetical protein